MLVKEFLKGLACLGADLLQCYALMTDDDTFL